MKTHENCGGEVEQLISAPALHFKGSGWYVTDYAKNGKSPSNSSSGQSDSSKTETKSESTPPTKTETKSETKSSEPAPSTK